MTCKDAVVSAGFRSESWPASNRNQRPASSESAAWPVRGATDRARLAAIVADRNRPQKHVWRARVADPKAIIAAAKRGHQTLQTIHQHPA
jgi:hypothetical protein